jgi:hypothetical protein
MKAIIILIFISCVLANSDLYQILPNGNVIKWDRQEFAIQQPEWKENDCNLAKNLIGIIFQDNRIVQFYCAKANPDAEHMAHFMREYYVNNPKFIPRV